MYLLTGSAAGTTNVNLGPIRPGHFGLLSWNTRTTASCWYLHHHKVARMITLCSILLSASLWPWYPCRVTSQHLTVIPDKYCLQQDNFVRRLSPYTSNIHETWSNPHWHAACMPLPYVISSLRNMKAALRSYRYFSMLNAPLEWLVPEKRGRDFLVIHKDRAELYPSYITNWTWSLV